MFQARPFGAAELAAYEMRDQSLATARFAPDIPEWSGPCVNTIAPIFQQIIGGELTAEVGMNQAADAIEAILDEARYYEG